MGGSQSTHEALAQMQSGATMGANAFGQAGQTLQQAQQTAASFQQAAQPFIQTSSNAYKAAQDYLRNTVKTGGGSFSGGYFGGDETSEAVKDLRAYENSLAAATKENLIRGLARALKKGGLSVDPEADLETIVKQIKNAIPNPKNGSTFAQDSKVQSNICKTIAGVLNNEFTPGASPSEKLIDTSAGPASICGQVYEYVYSLSTGLQTEFLEVHASIKRAMRNIDVMDEIMKSIYDHVMAELSVNSTTDVTHKVEPFNEAYKRLRAERDRQLKLLQGFLNTTLSPAREELAIAMAEEGDTYKLLKNMKLVPGTGEFGDALASAISGLGTAAGIASRIHKALKQIGLSTKEYLDSASWKDFDTIVDSKRFSGQIPIDDVGKFERAVKILRETFWRREELKDELESGLQSRVTKGAAEPTPLDRRIEQRKIERKLILKQYLDKSSLEYGKLLQAINNVGPLLGKSVSLSDKLEALRDALSRINDMGTIALDLSLIGFYTSSMGRQQRDTFIAQLKVVLSALDDVVNLELYKPFGQFAYMREAIVNLLKIIDYYTDFIEKKYGGNDEYDGGKERKRRGGDDGDDGNDNAGDDNAGDDNAGDDNAGDDNADDDNAGDDTYGGKSFCGGANELTVEELGLAEVARSQYDLRESINRFLYFYYVAKVRSNLSQTKQELAVYGEKYTNILGDAVAGRLSTLLDQQKTRITSPTTSGGLGLEPDQGVSPQTDANKLWKAAKKAIDQEFDIKKRFYRALEAMDLYMRAFTDGIISNPDDIKDIKHMLDGVQVIGRWFTEQTGNDLAKLFEMFPTAIGTPSSVMEYYQPDKHYYEAIQTTLQNNRGVGTIHPILATDAEKLYKQVGAVLSNFQALKNIVSTFAHMGDKFGGEELRRKVFMSPSQIYKALVDYIQYSSINVGIQENYAAGAAHETMIAGANEPIAANHTNAAQSAYLTMADRGIANDPLRGYCTTEDIFFSFIIKAMGAKILTVLGVYDLFERPEPIYQLTPTRMIIGGADYDTIPEIIAEATELYFRLPRLAEFYRDLFGWNNEGTDLQISMLPEMEGVFSGFIRQIFLRSAINAENGDYSDMEMRQIVREINNIYQHFHTKNGEKCVSEALSQFVMEINRRYSIIKKTEWAKFQTLLREVRDLQQPGSVSQTNYSILPGEDEPDDVRMAPSDRFMKPGENTGNVNYRPSLYDLDSGNLGDTSNWAILRSFRAKLDMLFATPEVKNQFGKISYRGLIKQAEKEIQNSPNDKFTIIARLIQGSRSVSGMDVNKSFMFHETVVMGLNILNGTYTLLSAFREQMKLLDVEKLEKGVRAWLASGAFAPTRANLVDFLSSEPGGNFPAEVEQLIIDGNAGAAGVSLGLYFQTPEFNNATVNIARVTTQTLYAWIAANRADANSIPLICRYVLNRNEIMRRLIIALFELTADSSNMVQLRFPRSTAAQIQLDFAQLRGVIESLMGEVRIYLDIFRTQLPEDIIKRYEQKTTGVIENIGSLYWLEDKLMDNMIRGLTDASGTPLDKYNTLENLARQISISYNLLTKKYTHYLLMGVGGAAGDPAAFAGTQVANGDGESDQYGRAFSALIHYDCFANVNSGILANNEGLSTGYRLVHLIRLLAGNTGAATHKSGWIPDSDHITKTYRLPIGRGKPDADATAGQDTVRTSIYDDMSGFTQNRSLMMMFNQLLASYLTRFYDNTTGKIYHNLIGAFSNGIFSQSVMENGYSHPDLAGDAAINFGRRADPTGRAVLLTSLALVLRRLTRDMGPTGAKYLTTTLAEVPNYIKESYRGNLPMFVKYFDLISKEGEMLKQFLQYTEIQVGKPNIVSTARGVGGIAGGDLADIRNRIIYVNDVLLPSTGINDNFIVGFFLPNITFTPFGGDAENKHAMVKGRLISIIDSITNGAYTLSNAGSEILKELADDPIFFQTEENSIQNYKTRYNRMPLMPLSLSLVYLTDVQDRLGRKITSSLGTGNDVVNDIRLSPSQDLGDNDFKFTYGMRKLLGSPPITLGEMPGVKAIVESYNNLVTSKDAIDIAQYEMFVKHIITALRFIVDTRSTRSNMIVSSNTFAGASLIIDPAANNNVNKGIMILNTNIAANAVYELRSTITDVLSIVESSYQEEQINNISMVVSNITNPTVSLGANRKMERIFNIIDMNIIPINVHALMRGMALVNTYNYVYTFEQMACLMYGIPVETIRARQTNDIAGANAVTNTREFFLKLLLEPYTQVSLQIYGSDSYNLGTAGFAARIFRGDNALGMGRPKFLSDQLFGKALFGSLVPTIHSYDEAGPGVAAGITRGHQNVGNPNTIELSPAGNTLFRDFVASVAVEDHGTKLNLLQRHQNYRERFIPLSLNNTRTIFNNYITMITAVRDAAANANAAPYNNPLSGQTELHEVEGTANAILAEIGAAGAGGNTWYTILERVTGTGGGVPANRIDNILDTDPGNADRVPLAANVRPAYEAEYGPINIAALGAGDLSRSLIGRIMIFALTPQINYIVNQSNAAQAKMAKTAIQLLVGANPGLVWMGINTALGVVPGNFNPTNNLTAVNQSITSILTYLDVPGPDGDGWSRVKQVGIGVNGKQYLSLVGKDRFDTRLVRNLFFITNVHRLLRHKLTQDLTINRSVIATSHGTVDRNITEYGFDLAGPNEVFGQRTYDSDSRYM